MGQVSPDSTTSASRSQVQQLKDTIFIGIVNGECFVWSIKEPLHCNSLPLALQQKERCTWTWQLQQQSPRRSNFHQINVSGSKAWTWPMCRTTVCRSTSSDRASLWKTWICPKLCEIGFQSFQNNFCREFLKSDFKIVRDWSSSGTPPLQPNVRKLTLYNVIQTCG